MRWTDCSLEFLRRISRRRRSAKYGVESISEYVERRAALLMTRTTGQAAGRSAALERSVRRHRSAAIPAPAATVKVAS
jgi:hypothetical protein